MSTTPISTNGAGQPIAGTTGTTIDNASADQLGTNQFLDLLMDQLKYQDPSNPTDPNQYMAELAQMSSVEQESNIATSTSQSASAGAVNEAVGLIGHTVTYTDAKSGSPVTGAVQSVQIGTSGPTMTIGGVAGIAPSAITAVSGDATSPGTS